MVDERLERVVVFLAHLTLFAHIAVCGLVFQEMTLVDSPE